MEIKITTKFSLGDVLWTIYGDKVVAATIEAIEYRIDNKGGRGGYYTSVGYSIYQDEDLFTTREEAVAKFNKNLEDKKIK